jgi:hypothetical protein
MKISSNTIPCVAVLTCGLLFADRAQAWDLAGHTAVGVLALQQTDTRARAELEQILGSLEATVLAESCNWPDVIREQQKWAWTAPLHYVNIPRNGEAYDVQRDCREGLCVTEGIKHHAARLADGRLSRQKREQSFAWLCHLVADLHHPLHCGYADDQGGNAVNVVFGKTEMDLHEFWDAGLIQARAGSAQNLVDQLAPMMETVGRTDWSPDETNQWTGESHRLVAEYAYPGQTKIDTEFAEVSWRLTQEQLIKAARRLARILNATLGEGTVELR